MTFLATVIILQQLLIAFRQKILSKMKNSHGMPETYTFSSENLCLAQYNIQLQHNTIVIGLHFLHFCNDWQLFRLLSTWTVYKTIISRTYYWSHIRPTVQPLCV